MGKMLSRKAVLATKIETVEGTAESLTNADCDLLIQDPKFDPDLPMYKRENIDQSLSRFLDVPGTQAASLSFKVEVKGSGTAITPPKVGKLLKACGWSETVATGVTYKPSSSTTIPSLTMALYRDGIKKLMRGCRGSVSYAAKNGEPGIFTFNFMGVFDGVTDAAMLTTTGIETTIPKPLLSAAFTVQGYAAFVQGISWDCGNEMEMRANINDPTGWVSCLLGPRDFKGTIDPEEEHIAACDWYGLWKSGTAGVLTWKHPGTAGQDVTFTCNKVQYAKVAEGARGTIAILNTDFTVVRDTAAGDDEMSILFD